MSRHAVPPGCLSLLVLGGLLPFLLANVLLAALGKLGLDLPSSLLVALGIFGGSLFNIPVARIEHERTIEFLPNRLLGLHRLLTRPVRRQTYSVIAVNVGGCLVPTALAGYQVTRLALQAPSILPSALGALAVNVGVCYYAARPVPETGITMPAVLPAAAAALCALLLTPEWAPPVAFVAGVLGPLIGADFLHLDVIADVGPGMASLGGAGTFDGIVLSGLVATLLTPGAL